MEVSRASSCTAASAARKSGASPWPLLLLGLVLTLGGCRDGNPDMDKDGVPNDEDAFPLDAAEWADTDGDGLGNNRDPDIDNDGFPNNNDAFPLDAGEYADLDGDGIGNNSDTDIDGDDIPNDTDAFPFDTSETADTDGDGIGNNVDPDIDGDGVANAGDAFPGNATETVDTDSDGTGNNGDSDDDNDGTPDAGDAFPLDAGEYADLDGDGTGNNSDTDIDGDGDLNPFDIYPFSDAAVAVEIADEPAGSNCANGGTVTRSGPDENHDGSLQETESDPDKTQYLCFPASYTIGGTVSGLPADGSATLILFNIGGESISISANGAFSFITPRISGTEYGVGVSVQPTTRFCEVAPGSSATGIVTAPVTDIAVVCREHGQATTAAGSGTANFADGTGTAAQFRFPTAVAVDGDDNVYVGDLYNQRIRKITPQGVVSTLAGSGTAGYADGTGAAAQFHDPYDVVVDKNGNVYVSDNQNNRIRKITPQGVVSTLAGSGTAGTVDGTGTAAQFNRPTDLTVDSNGNVYVLDGFSSRIRRIDPAGEVTTLSDSGFTGNPGGAYVAAFHGLAVNGSDVIYTYVPTTLMSGFNNCIVHITPAGQVSFVGGGTCGSSPPADIDAMAVDGSGNIYLADTNETYRIRKIDPAGGVYIIGSGAPIPPDPVSTLFTSGGTGFADGTGLASKFNVPVGIAVDSHGHVYVADANNNRIRKIYQVPGAAGAPQGNGYIGTILVFDGTGWTGSTELTTAFQNDATAMSVLDVFKARWDSSRYGTIPADSVIFDFAWDMCELISGCATPADAMTHALGLSQGDGMYNVILAAWTSTKGSAGWGGFQIGSNLLNSDKIPNEIEQTTWKAATTPANLIATASLLQGMLGQLQAGDPGYGTSLIDAMKNLGNDNAISRGLESVLLMTQAGLIIEMQRQGQTLTSAQQAFADVIVTQMLTQAKATLNQLRTDFYAYQEANRPSGMGGLFYLGAAPTDAMKNTLVSLIPQSSGSARINDTATTSGRLLTAIGLSQKEQSDNSAAVSADVVAGLGVGVPLASAMTSITIATVGFSATFAGASAATAASAGAVLGISGGLGASASAGAAAAALAGPAVIVVAAVALIAGGAAIVAQVNEFVDTMNFYQALLTLQTQMPPTLGVLVNNHIAGGSDAQMQYALINLVASGGFQF